MDSGSVAFNRPGLIGKTITLQGVPFKVIGVRRLLLWGLRRTSHHFGFL
jgi:hypothetical protein